MWSNFIITLSKQCHGCFLYQLRSTIFIRPKIRPTISSGPKQFHSGCFLVLGWKIRVVGNTAGKCRGWGGNEGAWVTCGRFLEEIDTHVLRISYGIWVGKIVFLIFRICVNNSIYSELWLFETTNNFHPLYNTSCQRSIKEFVQ